MNNEITTEKVQEKFLASKLFKIREQKLSVIMILIVILSVTILLSFTVGRYGITTRELFQILSSKILNINSEINQSVETVLFKVRIPRVAVVVIIGGALSIAGVTYQGMFKNPMV